MPGDPTGVKPAGQQTEVPPTSEPTGEKQQTVPPTGQTPPVIEEDNVIEKDGEKVVPLSAHIAQREDYQKKIKELEEQVSVQATPQEPTEPQETPTEEAIDWDEILDIITPQQPQQPTQQPVQQPQVAQPQPTQDWFNRMNEQIREMRENGNEIGAYALLRQMERGYESNMKRTARRWIKDYDDLPLGRVADEEVVAFQQNPEAIRGILAKLKSGKSISASDLKGQTPPAPDNNNAPPANWQELQEKLRQEGRDEAIRGIASQSGTSFEGARGGGEPSGETFELDDFGKNYLRKRGVPEDKWPQYAEQLNKEMEGRY